MDHAEAGRLIASVGWLAAQASDVRADILARARLIELEKDRHPFHPGDDPGGFYGIVRGGIGVRLSSEDQEVRLVHIARTGVWFGYSPFVRGGLRPLLLSYATSEPSWLFFISLSDLVALESLSPRHQRALLSISDFAMDIAVEVIDTLMLRSPAKRVAATLLRVCEPDADGVQGSARLSQSQLGEMSNCDRKVVNRVFRKLAGMGLVRGSYSQVAIADRAALRAFVLAD